MTKNLIIVGLLAGLFAFVHGQEVKSTPIPKPRLEPFLKEYCARCHGPEKQKGDVRFDEVSWRIKTNDEAQRWQACTGSPEKRKQFFAGKLGRASVSFVTSDGWVVNTAPPCSTLVAN